MALFNSKRPSKIRRNVPTICHARPPIHPDSNVIKHRVRTRNERERQREDERETGSRRRNEEMGK